MKNLSKFKGENLNRPMEATTEELIVILVQTYCTNVVKKLRAIHPQILNSVVKKCFHAFTQIMENIDNFVRYNEH